MGILINNTVKDNFDIILNDSKFPISKYGIKPGRVKKILENNNIISIENAKKIQEIYNNYYKNETLSLKELFNINTIKGYIEDMDKVDFNYGRENRANFIRNFWIVLTQNFEKFISNIGDNIDNFKNKIALAEEKEKYIIIIIILILFYLIYNLLFGNIFFQDNSNKNSNNIPYHLNHNLK